MTALSPAEFRVVLRADFYSFLVRCFAELHAGRSYSPSWHVEAMAAKLRRVRDGGTTRLIINVPPRHLKSLAASVALPAGCSATIRRSPSSTSPMARTSPTSSPATAGR